MTYVWAMKTLWHIWGLLNTFCSVSVCKDSLFVCLNTSLTICETIAWFSYDLWNVVLPVWQGICLNRQEVVWLWLVIHLSFLVFSFLFNCLFGKVVRFRKRLVFWLKSKKIFLLFQTPFFFSFLDCLGNWSCWMTHKKEILPIEMHQFQCHTDSQKIVALKKAHEDTFPYPFSQFDMKLLVHEACGSRYLFIFNVVAICGHWTEDKYLSYKLRVFWL